jgi:glycosyltransferase involved in cell wall biosynthesis
MKIVHVVETLDRGGLERTVCDLAAAQKLRGDQVSALCLFRRGLLADELESRGVPVSAIGKRTGNDFAALWRLRRALRVAGADVVHTHNATAHYHTAWACWPRSDWQLLNTRHGMGDGAGKRVEARFRRSLDQHSRVAAVSEFSGRHLVAGGVVPEACLRIVPNGIPVQRFGQNTRSTARARLGLPLDVPVVGTVGRLHSVKDQAGLIRAVVMARQTLPALRCIVIGDGELRGTLEALVAETNNQPYIQLLGDRSDVAELLPAMDLFALPSHTEGYSIALLEAAASGVPMLVSDVGGNREIVADGVTGRVIPRVEPIHESLAKALLKLLSDFAALAQMGAAARRWAVEHASVESMVQRYDALYRGAA